ncbi:MAG: GntR family transcriptional regulator [Betaproteobacteria bacterium]|nr:GntR family transcriptional regulator [Betaproteobacteria bacterium]
MKALTGIGPLYKEVRRRLLECLAGGEWKPGERIPSEPDLARRFGVAISTIRAGISDLAAAGVVNRWQGRGTFVARHDLHPQGFRFSNIYDTRGQKVFTEREITSFQRIAADGEIARKLGLAAAGSNRVCVIEAVLRSGGIAVATMALILPARFFPRLRAATMRQTGENLYALYQKSFGVTVIRMDEWVRARKAPAALARTLGIATGDPVLEVERIAYTFGDVPVELRRRTYEATRHQYLFSHDRLA